MRRLLPLAVVAMWIAAPACIDIQRATPEADGQGFDTGLLCDPNAGPGGCDDGDPCTVGSCSAEGVCTFSDATDVCRLTEGCAAQGEVNATDKCLVCDVERNPTGWSPVDCDDGNACTADSCEAGSGCVTTALSDVPCDDGSACTTGDTCVSGECKGDDSDCPCVTDADCVGKIPASDCQRLVCSGGQCVATSDSSKDGQSCQDGDLCRVGATCSAGVCEGGAARDCSSLTEGPCRPGVCLATTGECAVQAEEDGASCDDGDACTLDDTCAEGTCAGVAMDCSEFDKPPCVNALCADGACTFQVSEGTGCADGCVIDATCDGSGNCVGSWSTEPGCACASDVDCDDGLGCTIDKCNVTTGECVFEPLPTACVIAGTCYFPGDPHPLDICRRCDPETSQDSWQVLTCDDGNPCTDDACDAQEGCVSTPVAETGCDDGDPCTTDDHCDAGVCVGTCECKTVMDCAGVDVPVGACEKVACIGYKCQAVADEAKNGSPCDAGLCTEGAVCQDGACGGGGSVTCAGPTQGGCVVEACDPSTGACVQEVAEAGASCDDGDACTVGDQCDAEGACVGSPKDCSAFADACNDATCEFGACATVPKTDAPCDDGDGCTVGDACTDGGFCAGVLDPTIQGCGCQAAGDCDDGLSCTLNSCSNGGCVATVKQGSCFIASGCYDSGASSPGNACKVCDPAASQSGWTTSSCDDGNPCTDDSCDPATGCVHAPAVGKTCNDGDPCTQDEACDGNGACVGTCECTMAADCQGAAAPCKAWACDNYACIQVADPTQNGTSCEDGLYCTDGDTCQAGACEAGPPRDCSASGDGKCKLGVCDEDENQCEAANRPDGDACQDGDACTENDKCAAGVCKGTAKDCSGLVNQCNTAACVGGACQQSPTPGANCDDGEGCTLGDTCSAGGTCQGDWDTVNCGCESDADCTGFTDACNVGRCDVQTNECYGDPTSKLGTACDDGQACTQNDKCAAGEGGSGECVGAPFSCNDQVDCTDDVCLGDGTCDHPIKAGTCFVGGVCYNAGQLNPDNPCEKCVAGAAWSDADGVSCDDGDKCTSGDVCAGGECGGEAYSCTPPLSCQSAACDGAGGCTVTIQQGFCVISDTCYASGALNPSNPCKSCQPSKSTTAWSDNNNQCDDGNACTYGDLCKVGSCSGTPYGCDDGKTCTAGTCNGDGSCTQDVVSGCLIGGTCRANGAINPNNQCEWCDEANPTVWSPRPAGAGCDDGLSCTSGDACDGAGVCEGSAACAAAICETATCETSGGCTVTLNDGWCKIGGQCYGDGTSNPSNPCQVCDPAQSTGSWSDAPEWTSCDDGDPETYGDFCSGGSCTGYPCECDDGLACTDDSCDADGSCSYTVVAGTCYIDGECFDAGDPGYYDDCQHCDPDVSQFAWTNKPNGSACEDDGLSCTSDTCTAGTCQHSWSAGTKQCYIDYACWGAGETSPESECQQCSPAKSGTTWTNVVNGTPCGGGDAGACEISQCQYGYCMFSTVADFTPCDDSKSGTFGDWCYGGGCGGFVQASTDTSTGEPDEYTDGKVTWDGDVFGLYPVAPNAICTICKTEVAVDHFSTSTTPDATHSLVTGLSGPVATAATTDAVTVEAGLYELDAGAWKQNSSFSAGDKQTTTQPTQLIHDYLTTTRSTSEGSGYDDTLLAADDATNVMSCLNLTNSEPPVWDCVQDAVNLPVSGVAADFVSYYGEPYLVMTDANGILKLFAEQGETQGSESNVWTSVASTTFGQAGRYARAATVAGEHVVIVGDGGRILVGNVWGSLSQIVVPNMTHQSSTRFADVGVFDSTTVMAIGVTRVGGGAFESQTQSFVIAHAPVGDSLTNGGSWRFRTVRSDTATCGPTGCTLDGRRWNAIAPLQSQGVFIFGAWSTPAWGNDMRRAVWFWAAGDGGFGGPLPPGP